MQPSIRPSLALLFLSVCGACGDGSPPLDGGAADAQPVPDGAIDGGIDAFDGGDADAGIDAADHPARYPTDRTLSPITQYVARSLADMAARGDGHDDAHEERRREHAGGRHSELPRR